LHDSSRYMSYLKYQMIPGYWQESAEQEAINKKG